MDVRKKFRNRVILSSIPGVLLTLSSPLFNDNIGVTGAIIATLFFLLLPLISYFASIKHVVLMHKVRPLFELGLESKELEMANVYLHYGRYRMALLKLRFASLEFPECQELKTVIKAVEQYVKR